LDGLDTSVADGLMLWVVAYSHIIVPASFTFLALCPEYFHPHLFFILRPKKGDRRHNKN
jgi:hypothetical protein